MSNSGYEDDPAEIRAAAEGLRRLGSGFAPSVARFADDSRVVDGAFGNLPESGEVAKEYWTAACGAIDGLNTLLATFETAAANLVKIAANYEQAEIDSTPGM